MGREGGFNEGLVTLHFGDPALFVGIPRLDALVDGLAGVDAPSHPQGVLRELYTPVECESGVLLFKVLHRTGVAELLERLSSGLRHEGRAAMANVMSLQANRVATGFAAIVTAFSGDPAILLNEHGEQHDGMRFKDGSLPCCGHLLQAECLVVSP